MQNYDSGYQQALNYAPVRNPMQQMQQQQQPLLQEEKSEKKQVNDLPLLRNFINGGNSATTGNSSKLPAQKNMMMSINGKKGAE